MKLDIDHFAQARDLIAEAAGDEAGVIAQFALDLAIAARCSPEGLAVDAAEAKRQLSVRLALHRQAHRPPSDTVH